ncbi:MAG: PTS system mannose/fructose/sorbose family transporter subunit IID [Anaerococcus prevotii]|uniref:PTS system mannose/fructose/sorbose family transporter subunit IID n=1 Tax=Anaerococcus prevotii TaxID=33034 RepID=UPI002903DA83|nr:PTS system mannose/fructose/sorbose family transporter subunit IID [Anaerococcus prevotii]MDU2558829.1 PTS system mannose/fructose/sorbose family transporter subunit IID [Anaerococcus prevotii]
MQKKYYSDDPEAAKRLMERHSMFYNTEPQTGQLVTGIVTSLEEQIALGEDISEDMPVNIKTTLMGPLAGIGDSIIQGIIVPTLLSIGMGLAASGSALGPLFYIISYAIIGTFITYISFNYGYKLGINAIDTIVGENAQRITSAFNVVGVIVVGALAAANINLTTKIEIPMGSEVQQLQALLDGIFPKLLPFAVVMLSYWLLRHKKVSATKVILILVALVSVGVILGVF